MPLRVLGAAAWGDIWGRHQRLIIEQRITTIDLEATDAAKWRALCQALDKREHNMGASGTQVLGAAEQAVTTHQPNAHQHAPPPLYKSLSFELYEFTD